MPLFMCKFSRNIKYLKSFRLIFGKTCVHGWYFDISINDKNITFLIGFRWNKKKTSFLMEWTFGQLRKHLNYDTNSSHRCPLTQNFSFHFDNVKMNNFFPVVPLLPSGHYRLDIAYTEANHSNIYFSWKFYFEISDHRLEQY